MIPEEFIWKMAWQRALGLAFLQILIPIVAGYVGLTVAFFRRGETAACILCVACLVLCLGFPVGVLVALGIGWLRAGKWGMRAFMALWTGLVAIACLNVTALFTLRNLSGATLRAWFGSS